MSPTSTDALLKKFERRTKKKNPKMKVHGQQTKALARLIFRKPKQIK